MSKTPKMLPKAKTLETSIANIRAKEETLVEKEKENYLLGKTYSR